MYTPIFWDSRTNKFATLETDNLDFPCFNYEECNKLCNELNKTLYEFDTFDPKQGEVYYYAIHWDTCHNRFIPLDNTVTFEGPLYQPVFQTLNLCKEVCTALTNILTNNKSFNNQHPDAKCRKNQEEFLRNCPSSSKREFHARLFRIGNVTYRYHEMVFSDLDNIPELYYREWLEGLPEGIKADMEKRGFEGCKTVISFTRYVNERRDIGYEEWLQKYLSNEDYKYHLEQGKKLKEI